MTIPFHDATELEAYCRPFIDGKKLPQTAAELMASRYVAYATEAVDYLLESHDPKTRSEADRKATLDWSRRADWRGLEIVSTEKGGPEDDTGKVEFVARYAIDGVEHKHHELADFRRIEGRWFFIDGSKASSAPVVRAAPKVGRNDPCTCGSGKKFKKCCGA